MNNMVQTTSSSITRESLLQEKLLQKGQKSRLSLYLCVVAVVVLLAGSIWKLVAVPKQRTIDVVVPSQALHPGCPLRFDSVEFRTIPARFLTSEMQTSCEKVIGRYAKEFIPAGEPILSSYLFPEHESLSNQLRHNEEAVTLALPPDSLVDHCIRAGDHVDALLVGNKNDKKYARTILQDLSVLLVAPKASGTDKNAMEQNRITLAVNQKDVEKLSLAAEYGRLRLALRSADDHTLASSAGSDERDVLPGSAFTVQAPVAKPAQLAPAVIAAIPPPPPPAVQLQPPVVTNSGWTVQVFKGSQREEHVFPGQAFSDQASSEHAFPNQASSEHAFPNQAFYEHAFPDQASSEHAFPKQAFPKQASSDQSFPIHVFADRH
jgi:Flp pilus assembly protein CpaB